jgi:hypothetical protein
VLLVLIVVLQLVGLRRWLDPSPPDGFSSVRALLAQPGDAGAQPGDGLVVAPLGVSPQIGLQVHEDPELVTDLELLHPRPPWPPRDPTSPYAEATVEDLADPVLERVWFVVFDDPSMLEPRDEREIAEAEQLLEDAGYEQAGPGERAQRLLVRLYER